MKTRVGSLVQVNNKNKVKGALNDYQCAILKSNNVYSNYLFTEVELSVALSRARKNPEDLVERSFTSKLID